jgi:hypothetical protein
MTSGCILSGRAPTSILPPEIEHEPGNADVFSRHLRMLAGPLPGPSINSRDHCLILSSVSYAYLHGSRILRLRIGAERVGYSAKSVSRMMGEILGDR